MKKKCILFISLALMLVLAACGGGNAASNNNDSKVLRLAHTQAPTHPVHISMEKFAELVEEKTDGSVKVEIFPSGTLGDERKYIENLQTGTLDMAKVSVNSMENFEPVWSIFSIPYVFDNFDQGRNFMNSEYIEELYSLTTDSLDTLGLTWYDAGGRNYYTKNVPVESPADMEGLLMRVQASEILIETVETLGGSATPIDFGELYTAIQQGVVDGADNGIVAFTENNLGEVAKHFSFTEHVFSPDVLLIKNSTFESLSPEQQEAIKEAATESTAFHSESWEQEEADAVKKSEDAGVTIYHPDLTPFREVLEPIKEKYAAENEKIAELMQTISEIE